MQKQFISYTFYPARSVEHNASSTIFGICSKLSFQYLSKLLYKGFVQIYILASSCMTIEVNKEAFQVKCLPQDQ
uniref:Uncharacterized protein LOC100805248 n=1 Tax=Rhizophora mucronata TaxID=61149 RepID=A0A2P2KTR3_RHIMU